MINFALYKNCLSNQYCFFLQTPLMMMITYYAEISCAWIRKLHFHVINTVLNTVQFIVTVLLKCCLCAKRCTIWTVSFQRNSNLFLKNCIWSRCVIWVYYCTFQAISLLLILKNESVSLNLALLPHMDLKARLPR